MSRRARAPRARISADSRPVVYVATALVVAVGIASFVVSWSALVAVAAFAGVAEQQRVFVPLLVDGALAAYQLVLLIQRERNNSTTATWVSLWAFVALSVAANAVHAIDAGAGGYRAILGVCLAAAAPIGLLAATHALASVAISAPPVVRKIPVVAPVVVEVVATPVRKRIAPKPAPAKSMPKLTTAPTAASQPTDAQTEQAAEFIPVADRAALKTDVLRMYSEGVHERAIAAETGVSLTSVRRWISQAKTQVAA